MENTNVPITYIPNFVPDPKKAFASLWNELDWVRHDKVPRREYYCNDFPENYTYGKPEFARTYQPQPYHAEIVAMRWSLEKLLHSRFEVVFLNGYEGNRDQLGWHADDSAEMCDDRPIGIISLGAVREIWFAPKNDLKDVTRLKLASGSLCVMHPGMQDTHLHRIPKADYECGSRISLTFRGYVRPVNDR